MEYVIYTLAALQLYFLDQTIARPVNSLAPSNQENVIQRSESYLQSASSTAPAEYHLEHRDQEIYPDSLHFIKIKEKKSRLAKATAKRAAKEAAYGVVGGIKAVGYGFQQGYYHAKEAAHQYKMGDKKQGTKQLGNAVAKVTGGVALSVVPIIGGLGASVYSGARAAAHTVSSLKASKIKDSKTPFADVLWQAEMIKADTPVREKTNDIVHHLLQFDRKASARKAASLGSLKWKASRHDSTAGRAHWQVEERPTPANHQADHTVINEEFSLPFQYTQQGESSYVPEYQEQKRHQAPRRRKRRHLREIYNEEYPDDIVFPEPRARQSRQSQHQPVYEYPGDEGRLGADSPQLRQSRNSQAAEYW